MRSPCRTDRHGPSTPDEPEPLLDNVTFAPLPHIAPAPLPGPGRNFVSIRFLQVDDPSEPAMSADAQILRLAVDRIVAGAASTTPPPDLELNRYRTVVEMVTFVASLADLYPTAEKPDPLKRCLTALFELHRSYRLLAKLTCEELTYRRLHPLVLTTRRRPAEPRPTPDGITMLDMRPNRIGAVREQIGSVDFSLVTAAAIRTSQAVTKLWPS
jgi:hypothetical protein